MKHILFSLLTILSISMAACATGSMQTERPVETGLPPTISPTPSPSASSTSTVTPTTTPTPIFTLDPSKYDPDIFPAGVVEHQPPLIARSDENVTLAFWLFDTIYCEQLRRYCRLEPLLYYSYGEGLFRSVSLVKETVSGIEQWVARLPATDQTGKSLRYYAEFSFPEAGYTQRYPAAGTIDLFTAEHFLPVELSAAHSVEPGDRVYMFYWGYGHNTVHKTDSGHILLGPSALDVARDGRIALLNPVDNHVLIYDPAVDTYSSFPLPFVVYPDSGDLAFDQDDRLMVCDFDGKRDPVVPGGIPYCYRLLPDGTIGAEAPAYINSPIRLTEDCKLLDRYDYELVVPFSSREEANSREDQRNRENWELAYRLVERDGVLDWKTARFADIQAGVVFEVHSDFGLGVLLDFQRTPQGYLMLFSSSRQIRAVWIDPAGLVLKDVSLSDEEYTVAGYGRVAITEDGSLYGMSSTRNGIEIHFEAAP